MQETILALGALMIIMLIAINQQRSTIQMHEQAYVREIAQARDDFANLLLEGIVNEKFFDENTPSWTGIPSNPNSFSNPLGPDNSLVEYNDSTFDDVDDFHLYRDTFMHVISADTFRFDITFSVSYLTDSNTPSTAQTYTKQITAEIDPLFNFGIYGSTLKGRFSKTKGVFEDF